MTAAIGVHRLLARIALIAPRVSAVRGRRLDAERLAGRATGDQLGPTTVSTSRTELHDAGVP